MIINEHWMKTLIYWFLMSIVTLFFMVGAWVFTLGPDVWHWEQSQRGALAGTFGCLSGIYLFIIAVARTEGF